MDVNGNVNAGDRLNMLSAVENMYEGSQNTWEHNGRYFYCEPSTREHKDGAITGAIFRFTDSSLKHVEPKQVAGFRIEGNGKVARFPYANKMMKQSFKKRLKKRFKEPLVEVVPAPEKSVESIVEPLEPVEKPIDLLEPVEEVIPPAGKVDVDGYKYMPVVCMNKKCELKEECGRYVTKLEEGKHPLNFKKHYEPYNPEGVYCHAKLSM